MYKLCITLIVLPKVAKFHVFFTKFNWNPRDGAGRNIDVHGFMVSPWTFHEHFIFTLSMGPMTNLSWK